MDVYFFRRRLHILNTIRLIYATPRPQLYVYSTTSLFSLPLLFCMLATLFLKIQSCPVSFLLTSRSLNPLLYFNMPYHPWAAFSTLTPHSYSFRSSFAVTSINYSLRSRQRFTSCRSWFQTDSYLGSRLL